MSFIETSFIESLTNMGVEMLSSASFAPPNAP